MTVQPSSPTPTVEHRSGERSSRTGISKKRRARLLSSPGGQIAAIVMSTALIAASIAVPAIYLTPVVPLTMQILVICLLAFLFDGRTAAAGTGLYVLLGALGLPIFAGFRSGAAVLAGPTGGYLIGFVVAAGVVGWLSNAAHSMIRARRLALASAVLVATGLLGILIIHAAGVIGLMLAVAMPLPKAVAATLVFIIPDLLKALIAAIVAVPVLSAFRGQLLSRPAADGSADRSGSTVPPVA